MRSDSERRETLSEEKYGEELVIRDSDERKKYGQHVIRALFRVGFDSLEL